MISDETPLRETAVANRTLVSCLGNWLRTVGDVRSKTESELLRLPNFGRKALNDLVDVIGPWTPEKPREESDLSCVSTAALVAELARRF